MYIELDINKYIMIYKKGSRWVLKEKLKQDSLNLFFSLTHEHINQGQL